jgi:hypothetical protein
MPVDLATYAHPVQKALILRDRLTVALNALWALTLTLEKLHAPHALPVNITRKVNTSLPDAQAAPHQLIPPNLIRNARNARPERTLAMKQRSVSRAMQKKDM